MNPDKPQHARVTEEHESLMVDIRRGYGYEGFQLPDKVASQLIADFCAKREEALAKERDELRAQLSVDEDQLDKYRKWHSEIIQAALAKRLAEAVRYYESVLENHYIKVPRYVKAEARGVVKALGEAKKAGLLP
jgi:hypothetical protein